MIDGSSVSCSANKVRFPIFSVGIRTPARSRPRGSRIAGELSGKGGEVGLCTLPPRLFGVAGEDLLFFALRLDDEGFVDDSIGEAEAVAHSHPEVQQDCCF